MKNITVVGIGYVGLSLAILLSKKNIVTAFDIDERKVNKINNKKSPIIDEDAEFYLKNKKLNLKATSNFKKAFYEADFIVLALPTNYDPKNNYFDTSILDSMIKKIVLSGIQSSIIIKSTIPVGYTDSIRKKYKKSNIIFSPEFLREGKALYDNLYPSRIIIGSKCSIGQDFAKILLEGAKKNHKDIPCLYTSSSEAEAIKLFANSYLAMRVAYFNELDSYCESNKLNTKDIIDGVGLDPRIGNSYNNPSFGYGGYCLPKDTKQLLSNFNKTPCNIVPAIIDSNKTRKKFIAESILSSSPKTVGIFKLSMKQGSDNFRESAIIDIIKIIQSRRIKVVIYEESLDDKYFMDCMVINDLDSFKKLADIVVANRMSDSLNDIKSKVYTRDIYNED